MLEQIRIQVMNKIAENRKGVKHWINCWSPKSMKKYKEQLKKSSQCSMVFNRCPGDDRHTMFIDKQVYTCRIWDLIGIPCPHAICAFCHDKQDHFKSHF